MKINTIMFIIAVILSTGALIASITDYERISDIFRNTSWLFLGAGWTLIFLGY